MFLLKKRFWIVIILLFTPVLILWRAPASLLTSSLQQAAPPLKISGISGSLWSGSAVASSWEQNGHDFSLGRLKWKLSGLSLLLLNPCVDFSANASPQEIKGEVCYSLLGGDASLKQVDIQLPLVNVSPMLQVDIAGNVDGLIQSAVWDGQGFAEADMQFLWRGAEINGGREWVKLGDLQVKANAGDNGSLVSQWTSVASGSSNPPVDLALDIVLANLTAQQPSFKVNGQITPGPEARALQPMLQFIGDQDASGAYQIAIDE